jgi:hypothetical protein
MLLSETENLEGSRMAAKDKKKKKKKKKKTVEVEVLPPEPSLIDITLGTEEKSKPPSMPKELVLAAVVEEINGVHLRGALETALAIARLVTELLLDGDDQRLARGDKDPLLARLAEHPDLRMPPHTLWNSLAVYQQFNLLPPDVAGQLTLSHHRLLLSVPKVQAKVEMAQRAVKNDLSKRELREVVSRWRAKQDLPPVGRPPIDPAVGAARRMAAAALKLERALDEETPGAEKIDEIRSAIELLKKRLERVEKAVG